MAKQRQRISAEQKQRLVDEAGGKCANPGCAAYRTHLHHIREWAVYETNDEQHMIAICPSCHDAVHHGPLAIDDETVYRWKKIDRSATTTRDLLYVEPGASSKLLLGTIAVTGQRGVTVFDLGQPTRLSFRVEDDDLMLVNLVVSTACGDEVLRVVDNHVRHAAEDPVVYERVPGHVRVTVPASKEFIPDWAMRRLRLFEPEFAETGSFPLLDLEVLEPGLVRIQGVWNAAEHVVIAITPNQLAFVQPGMERPLSMIGDGADSVLVYGGPITAALFGIGAKADSALTIPLAPPPRLGRNDLCWCESGEKFKRCHGT
jgi:hypothetical protein